MYNEEIKLKWVNEYTTLFSISKERLIGIFNNAALLENIYTKDLCDFNVNELKVFYASFNSISAQSLLSCNTMMAAYSDWCIEKKISKTNINYFRILCINDFEKLTNTAKQEKKYISRDKLEKIIKYTVKNNCDELLFRLLYQGVRGKGSTELANLHINHVEGNILHLCTGRDVVVDDTTISLIYKTNETMRYIGSDGRESKLVGENVFKFKSSVKKATDSSLDWTFRRTIVAIGQENGISSLSPVRVMKSGELQMICDTANREKIDIKTLFYKRSNLLKTILKQYNDRSTPANLYNSFKPYISFEDGLYIVKYNLV